MSNNIINITERKKTGTNYCKHLRNKNFIPAIINNNNKNISIQIEEKIFLNITKDHQNHKNILHFNINNTIYNVLIKQIYYHQFKNKIIHIDFLNINNSTTALINVPINFKNENICPGLKAGGIINKYQRYLKVQCNINEIPEYLYIDLSKVNINNILKIEDIIIPKNIKIINNKNNIIAKINSPRIAVVEKTIENSIDEKDDEKKDKELKNPK